MIEQRCPNCKHYKARGEDNGYCRRYPPTILNAGAYQRFRTEFPEVSYHDWCGEFAESLEAIGKDQLGEKI